jgi:predicted transcriptional regulator
MTQSEVYKILKKKRKWMTSQEITDILGKERSCISKSLKQLSKYNEIEMKTSESTSKNYLGFKPYLYRVK